MWIIIGKNKLLRIVTIVFILLIILSLIFGKVIKTDAKPKGYIVLVIDDFGNNGDGTKEMLSLDIPITVAVMPFMSYSQEEAKKAHKAGFEVIMHVPMEPVHGKKEWLGPKGITCDLSLDEVKSRINEGLDILKYAKGMNNHMGSKVTQDKRIMKAILEIAKEKNLYFVDSKTTPKSIVHNIADKLGAISFERDIFLDNNKDIKSIEKQLLKLGNIAIKKGYAIGIGHVGPEGGTVTVKAIKNVYPTLQEQGIKFIYPSQLEMFTK
ncbi:divergent polysaccharide deacetylase family protein [Dethiothermospora halolimnae]|uniref:divergent polysaccharide deacetylase family protein n=1 Tax=Dethiothermospora halolimnae TaxID=3114390 RepID=UPI003CCC0AAE